MKKLYRALIVILFALVCALSLSGCFLFRKTVKDTITYHANGGVFENGATTVSVQYERGSKITLINQPSPARDGFNLKGWSGDGDSNYEINFYNYTVSGDDDFYAIWTPADSSLTFSSDFIKSDNSYNEYFTVVDSDVTQFSFGDKITCSCDWEICDVGGTTVYNLYPGDNRFTLQTVDEYGATLGTYYVNVHRSRTVTIEYEVGYSVVHTVDVPSGYPYTVDASIGAELEGRTVVGWKYGIDAVTEITPLHDMTLEAIIEYSNYNVTYDANGGELNNDTATATYQSYLRLASPRREGYTLLGWYDGETKIGDGNANVYWTIPRNVTLVAKWQIRKINVKALSDLPAGGSASGGGLYEYGTPLTLTATLNSGYTFLGWYTGTGNSTVLVSNDPIFETTVSLVDTYYARYQKSRLTASANRGNVVVPDKTVVGKPCTVSTEYSSLCGLTFDGWYLSGKGKVCDDTEYTFEMTRDFITLYASWSNPALNIFELAVTDVSCMVTGLKDSVVFCPARLVIPDEVTEIGERAFYQNDSIVTVTIGDGVTKIGNQAFFECPALVAAYVGSAVETVGFNVFYNSPKFVELKKPTDIEFSGNTTPLHVYSSGDAFVDFDDDGYIFYIDETANERYLLGYTGSDEYLTLPDDFAYAIYKYAFANSTTLTGLTIATKTTAIGDRAFYGCKNIVGIGYCATNATVGDSVFGRQNRTDVCKATTVRIAANVTHIPDKLFYSSYPINITAVTFGQNSMCEYIGGRAFSSLGIKTITVPERVTTIGAGAFDYCTAVTNIDLRATNLNALSSNFSPFSAVGSGTTTGATLNIGAGVTVIPAYLFYSSRASDMPAIKSVTFEENSALEEIGTYAFYGVTTLKNAIVPETVTTIGARAFYNCTGITAIEYSAAELDAADVSTLYIFSGAGDDGAVAVTIGAKVKSIPGGLFKNVTKINAVALATFGVCETIGDYAFYATEITAIDIPDSVTTIGERAFSHCTQVASLTVGTGLVTVGTYAFANLNNLSTITWNAIAAADNQNIFYAVGSTSASGISLTIGNDVTYIPSRLFYADAYTKPNLKKISFADEKYYDPQNVEIGDYAFAGVTSLYDVVISWRVTAIGEGAFKDCTGITSITYQANLPDFTSNSAFENAGHYKGFELTVDKRVTRIPANIFGSTDPAKQTRVESVVMQAENSCTEIGANAFYNCGEMDAVSLIGGVATVGEGAFGSSETSAVKTLTIGEGVTDIGVGAFENREITTVNFNAVSCHDFTLDNPCFTKSRIIFGKAVPRVPAYLTYKTNSFAFEAGSVCTEIGEGAFYMARNGYVYDMPNSVKKIGDYAFYQSTMSSGRMSGGITEIGDYAFAESVNLNVLVLANVTKVGVGAFKGCISLGQLGYTVDLSTKLEEIGEEAFAGDIDIRAITLPASLKIIGARAFQGCSSSLFKPTFADPNDWFANNKIVYSFELDTVSAARTALLDTYVDCKLTHA